MTNILTDLNNVLAQDTGTEKINADFVNYLGALDSTTWNKAKASYYLAKQAAVATSQLTVSPTPESLETYLTELNHTLNLTATATDDTYALVKASISGPSYSQSQLDSLQSKLNSDRGTCQNQLTTISGLQTTIRNLSDPGLTTAQNNNDLQRKYDSLQSAKLAVTQAENTLKKLQDAYPSELKTIENNLQDKKDNLTNLQNQVKAQQASLSDILRGATDEELTQTRNEVVLKELALSKAKEQITKYELRAPFDGVVSTIDYKVGDNIVADDSKYVYLQNPNLMQVIISLDQIDIVKVQTNMSATITFDALAEQSFAGTVTALDPAPVEQSGVVSYNVTVTLDKGTANLYSGMTATVKINLGKKENVLLLPSRALVTQGEQVLVNKLVNGQIVATPVVTGLSDEQNTEIISGLSEQDRVLINSQRTSTSSTTSSSSNNQNSDAMRQVMRVTSSGGGGGPPTP